jgi:hypothetical protein
MESSRYANKDADKNFGTPQYGRKDNKDREYKANPRYDNYIENE